MPYIPEQGYSTPCYESAESIQVRRDQEQREREFWAAEDLRRRQQNPSYLSAAQSWAKTEITRD